jgi:Fe-S cluster biogenesis protein NfuA/nitrite reductase/ring-hydroxylating ferredoxin subunit
MTPELRPEELLERIQDLTAQIDGLSDMRARALAQDLVSAVIAMYGDGLRRIMDVITESREAGATILDQLSQDGAVASLLLIHDLFPISLDERVTEALDTVRPYMESHGGNVELVSLKDGVAKLVLQGSCNGCAASRATLELAIKQALDEHAPDLVGLEVQGVAEPSGSGLDGVALPMAPEPPAPAFELPVVQTGPSLDSTPEALSRWVPVTQSGRPDRDSLRGITVDGVGLLLADVNGTLLAYVDECASCGEPLDEADLSGGMLRCCACETEFDLPRAGRAAGGEPLQLRPVPLLEAGGLRVAI